MPSPSVCVPGRTCTSPYGKAEYFSPEQGMRSTPGLRLQFLLARRTTKGVTQLPADFVYEVLSQVRDRHADFESSTVIVIVFQHFGDNADE